MLVQDGPIYGNSEVTCGKSDNSFVLATFFSDFYSDFYCGRREDNTQLVRAGLGLEVSSS